MADEAEKSAVAARLRGMAGIHTDRVVHPGRQDRLRTGPPRRREDGTIRRVMTPTATSLPAFSQGCGCFRARIRG